MRNVLFSIIITTFCSCKNGVSQKKLSNNENVSDVYNNVIMNKSGFADSNNFRKFKYYDTTGRMIFVIELGGIDNIRRMLSPVITDTGINSYLAGKYFYEEYFRPLFGNTNNYSIYIEKNPNKSLQKAFILTDSILYKNYGLHLLKSEFDNLILFLNR